ncbi:MAG: hypothetical protein PHU42_00205 [Patescibacteria group bacterium]|nr:hypothetical protein [Patescibacteria group bacterium]
MKKEGKSKLPTITFSSDQTRISICLSCARAKTKGGDCPYPINWKTGKYKAFNMARPCPVTMCDFYKKA